ncbi:DUF3331 domain-containing protein [Caballeronia sp. dw_276]|uniref:DUF3331 domain-containing protein n=1 Tax=Caballeronia sp. dw_276 TaxID=2719795 RepID=UPI001BD39800|nr:DUF3331 domain-containing protein [Caballeronia sp. dw_276]
MLAKAIFPDPWIQTLGLLSALSGEAATGVAELIATLANKGGKECALLTLGQPFAARVRLLDRPSQSTATIAWHDSTAGSYGDQVWHTSRSRVNGVCAMSGRAIQPGDSIYKPRSSKPTPVNASAMILDEVLVTALAAL